jgi:hypothetical protein
MFGLLYLFRCLPRPLRLVAQLLAICFVIAALVFFLNVFTHLLANVYAHRAMSHHRR